MARPREFNETDVLSRAMEVFWDRGYEAVSIEDLVTATGLARSSIYGAFANKRGLFDAVVEFYVQNSVGSMLAGLEAADADLDSVVEFFATLDAVEADYPDRFTLGCLITNTMTELGRHDETQRAVGTRHVQRLEHAFHNAVKASAPTPAEAITRAQLLATLTLGEFVRARGADPSPTTVPSAEIPLLVMRNWT